MIIDKVATKGIPYKCRKCGTLYAWKPDESDQSGKCGAYTDKRKCQELNCYYYEAYDSEQCPVCGTRHNDRISATQYKLLRALRRLWDG